MSHNFTKRLGSNMRSMRLSTYSLRIRKRNSSSITTSPIELTFFNKLNEFFFTTLILVFIFLASAFLLNHSVVAADITWDGGGTDGTCGGVGTGNNWSCGLNWDTNTPPTAVDTVIFDATSVKDATIDPAFTGTIFSLSAGISYTGTITQERSLTTTDTSVNSFFIGWGGTFNPGPDYIANSGNINIAGDMNVGSELFDATNISQISVGGNLTIRDGFEAPILMGVAGNVSFDGSPRFSPNTGTFRMTGANQTLNFGNEVCDGILATSNQGVCFYNFEKIVTAADTLTVNPEISNGEPGELITFNNLTLQGAPGALLTLQSASPGQPAFLRPAANINTISYVNFIDISNTSFQLFDGSSNSVDGGNNYGIDFIGISQPVLPDFYAIDSQSNDIATFNPGTGLVSARTPITLSGFTINNSNGLARDPNTCTLYGMLSAGETGRTLVTIDPVTGVAQRIGDTGELFAGITIASDGTMYGITGNGATTPETLFEIDKTNASITLLSNLGINVGGHSITYRPSDDLIYHFTGPLGSINSEIKTVNRTTFSENVLSSSGLTDQLPGNGGIGGVAYDESSDTIIVSNTNETKFWRFSPTAEILTYDFYSERFTPKGFVPVNCSPSGSGPAFTPGSSVAINTPNGVTTVVGGGEGQTPQSIEAGDSNAVSVGGNNEVIYLRTDDNGFYVARFTVNMSLGDLNLTGVVAQALASGRITLAENIITAVTNLVGTSYDLLIFARPTDEQVIICPDATTAADVSLNCSNGVIFTRDEAVGAGTTRLVGGNNVTVTIEKLADGRDYWVASGVTGTGGQSISGSLVIVDPSFGEFTSITSQEVQFQYSPNLNYNPGDQINVTIDPALPASLTGCTINPNTDIDDDTGGLTPDGSYTTLTNANAVFTITNTTTLAASNGVEMCITIPAGVAQGSYALIVTDSRGSFGATLMHVNGDNEIFVTAEVALELSQNIRLADDTADTNICEIGVVNTTTRPNHDTVIDVGTGSTGGGECGYGIAVNTNASGGFITTIESNGGMSNGTDVIADVVSGVDFQNATALPGGAEAYGIVRVVGSSNNVDVLGDGSFSGGGELQGDFLTNEGIGGTPVPITTTSLVSGSDRTSYAEGGVATDVTVVINGIKIGSTTPAGIYTQVQTINTTAVF